MPMGTGWFGRQSGPTVMLAETRDALTGRQLTKRRAFTPEEIAAGAGKFGPRPGGSFGDGSGGGGIIQKPIIRKTPEKFRTGGDGERIAFGVKSGGDDEVVGYDNVSVGGGGGGGGGGMSRGYSSA